MLMKPNRLLPLSLCLAGCAAGALPVRSAAPAESGAGTMAHTALHDSAAGLSYRLYLPVSGTDAPLLVMLHGCTQDAASFSAATRMLQHAGGVAVLYPEQPQEANPQRCWNWFSPAHQKRDEGEPALLAALTLRIAAAHDIDQRRIYVAGISAGGLMASILAATYPDIYAAVGVHSGGAFPTAATVADALVVMRGQTAPDGDPAAASAAAAAAVMGERLRSMPAVIVHGTADAVVHPVNAEHAAQTWWRVHAHAAGAPDMAPRVERRSGADGGRAYDVESLSGGAGAAPLVEVWRIHGLGHAWSGGVAGGSYTDEAGPDAALVMLRFLLAQRRP